MTLVDTSVWIRFLGNRAPFASELDRLLNRDEAVGHDLVYWELLIGDPKGRVTLLNQYAFLPRFSAGSQAEVVEFVREYKLHGRGIGWIDAHLLYSAIVNDLALWTADERLAPLAHEAGVGYRPRL